MGINLIKTEHRETRECIVGTSKTVEKKVTSMGRSLESLEERMTQMYKE